MFFGRALNRPEIDRLFQERLDADRRYNEALTALDKAVPGQRDLPHPPPGLDEHQVTPINERWDILSGNALDAQGGWRGRVTRILWPLLRPILERQQEFNSLLVDHMNRNIPVHRATRASIESTLDALRQQAEMLAAFHGQLILYLQTVTPYVDTKDRSETLALIVYGLSSGITATVDELRRRWEAMISRDQRHTSREERNAAALGEVQRRWEATIGREQRFAAAVDELRTSIGSVQQMGVTFKRELERLMSAGPAAGSAAAAASHPGPAATGTPGAGANESRDALNAYKYVGFENKFRGPEEEIRRRQQDYVELFKGASDVLDLGCGRGEFLALLRDEGITARGLDINHEMVEFCRAKDLRVDEGDALAFLDGLPDGSLGGLIAAQVVEHFQPPYLLRFLEVAYHKLRPGSRILLETVNAACWYAYFEAYLRDFTHAWPLHPDTLKYMVVASGFQRVDVRMLSPYPLDSRLQACQIQPNAATPELVRMVETLNANVDKLNALMFSHTEYAVVAERL